MARVDGAEPGTPRLRIARLSKRFGNAQVLDDVSLDVAAGEIHALVGQNGSGKSTLVKVLSGLHQPTGEFTLQVDGEDVPSPVRPWSMNVRGLAFVHQSLGLLPDHSVLENIRLGSLRGRGRSGLISWSAERKHAGATLARLGVDIDLSRQARTLHAGQRAAVAIARALQFIVPGEGCIVFDESTQSLPRDVLDEFYATVRSLAGSGTAILFVSHSLEEVLRLAHRVTVLRDGRAVAAAVPVGELTEAELAARILGRDLVQLERGEPVRGDGAACPVSGPARPTLQLRRVSGRHLRELDLDVRPGEIVGITGRPESGAEELPYLVSGAVQENARGQVVLGNNVVHLAKAHTGVAIAAGIVLVPRDRVDGGLALELTAADNLTLPRMGRASRHGFVRRSWQRAEFDRACVELGVVPARNDLLVGSFSGGNQQKILLAKWLQCDPSVICLHEPTQAVDVGARADILRVIGKAAARGAIVLMSSADTHDLAAICDRVLVLASGRVVTELGQPLTAAVIDSAVEAPATRPASAPIDRTRERPRATA